jgi:hypothetical protein
MAKGTYQKTEEGMIAEIPAGATWDWSVDESAQLAFDGDDTIVSAVWALDAGIVAGVIVTTTTKSSCFITAGAASDTPYRCTLTYTTAGGRITVRAFWLYVIDPILFT